MRMRSDPRYPCPSGLSAPGPKDFRGRDALMGHYYGVRVLVLWPCCCEQTEDCLASCSDATRESIGLDGRGRLLIRTQTYYAK